MGTEKDKTFQCGAYLGQFSAGRGIKIQDFGLKYKLNI